MSTVEAKRALVESFYVTGGTLQRDAPSYVRRRADRELYDGLRGGRFCYVLTSRQMGKSSLMVRTATLLREAGLSVAVLDLTAIGQNVTLEQWYAGLLDLLGQQIHLEDELDDFWDDNRETGPLRRWVRAIREVVLPRCPGQLVVFVDEIDAVRSLPFSTDEFFAAIREFYNARAGDPELERLTFCLLGVASPSDLIRDTRTTPFNVGQRIELDDFGEEEAAPLAYGFRREAPVEEALMERVLYWTGGHPYLTQRLCQEVAADLDARSADDVDRHCRELFLERRARERDDNLIFVRERLLRSEADRAALLELYGNVRRGRYVADDETDPLVTVLRLSGVVRARAGALGVRNRIYERVFDAAWIAANMPNAEVRRQRAAYRRGQIRAAAVFAVILAVMLALAFGLVLQRNRAEEQRLAAERARQANRRLLYDAQMNVAYQSWNRNPRRSLSLLENQIPAEGEEDLRGFEWYYLWKLCHHEAFSLRGPGPLNSASLSPDSKTLYATVEGTRDVMAWETDTGREVGRWSLPGEANVELLAISPDGSMLATAHSGGLVARWNLATMQQLSAFKAHGSQITYMAFAADGTRLVTGAPDDDEVAVWEAATGRKLASIATVQSVFSKGSMDMIALGHTDGTLQVVDTITGAVRLRLNAAPRGISVGPISPDGTVVPTCERLTNVVNVWEISTGRKLATLEGHRSWATAMEYSRDGRTLATGGADTAVKLWDTTTWRELRTLEGHSGHITGIAFLPDGRQIATTASDGTTRVWDGPTGRELAVLRGHTGFLKGLLVAPDGRRLFTGDANGTIKVWDLTLRGDGTVVLKGHSQTIYSGAVSPDGKTLATASHDTTAKLWDLATGRETLTLTGHTADLMAIAWSPDGKRLITGAEDNTARIWDASTGRELFVLGGNTKQIFCVAFSPDGALAATASFDGRVRLWDAATGREVASMLAQGGKSVESVAFSPDGRLLAAGGEAYTVTIWDVATRRQVATLRGHIDWVNALAFSPDGRVLATAGSYLDSTVKLWEVGTWREVTTLLEDAGTRANRLAFSPDGKRLVAGEDTSGVRVWDLTTGQELATLTGHVGRVHAISFTPNGETLVTGGDDATVRLWRAATEEEVRAQSGSR
jgi:WD40 repeat protein